jgi:hypothetical protein
MATVIPPTSPQTPEQPHEQTRTPSAQLQRTAPLSAPAERHIGLRLTLSALDAVLAIGAIAGALFVVPGLPRDFLLRGPFTDYTVPALALGILVGGSALVAAVMVLARPAVGALIAILSGVAIIVFELVEIAVVGLTAIAQPTEPAAWLQIFYLALGALIIALGAGLWRRTQRRALRPAFLPRR